MFVYLSSFSLFLLYGIWQVFVFFSGWQLGNVTVNLLRESFFKIHTTWQLLYWLSFTCVCTVYFPPCQAWKLYYLICIGFHENSSVCGIFTFHGKHWQRLNILQGIYNTKDSVNVFQNLCYSPFKIFVIRCFKHLKVFHDIVYSFESWAFWLVQHL